MRPYLFNQKWGGTWIDLDHILSIEPSLTHCCVTVQFVLRSEPVVFNYLGEDEPSKLIAAWKATETLGDNE